MTLINLADPPTPAEKDRLARLSISSEFRSILLPGCISVYALIHYSNLPGPTTIQGRTYETEDWLTSQAPDIGFLPGHLLQMPLPPRDVVKAIAAAIEGSRISGLASIKAHHLMTSEDDTPIYLPLWVVSYWLEAHEVRVNHQKWLSALEWMDQ